ncbi:uncharacterized protein L969DRAFT_93974 [Mixia osmundae IAM 14324]|uniref:Uncharacterized protein n=1 Tax=Mixia osmundae (strain CBS 9802 / IAM 14324 / JCM 22182 / KY 12970) TaxID=764103 RepID=G7E8P7_MIXOS|nr:uncharacterized protein L969DRAFT_93974 [Mixia osmundae IAM 14324]KEI40151.1 hypothetical protein L969DRAFT_93974 [Mixia osmundae IAM 14324]GAA99515.1 hypothetical protein E5Q_06216 [Mixia osmundae IAM 14324]
MGRSAKAYKRPTKAEKLGLAAKKQKSSSSAQPPLPSSAAAQISLTKSKVPSTSRELSEEQRAKLQRVLSGETEPRNASSAGMQLDGVTPDQIAGPAKTKRNLKSRAKKATMLGDSAPGSDRDYLAMFEKGPAKRKRIVSPFRRYFCFSSQTLSLAVASHYGSLYGRALHEHCPASRVSVGRAQEHHVSRSKGSDASQSECAQQRFAIFNRRVETCFRTPRADQKATCEALRLKQTSWAEGILTTHDRADLVVALSDSQPPAFKVALTGPFPDCSRAARLRKRVAASHCACSVPFERTRVLLVQPSAYPYELQVAVYTRFASHKERSGSLTSPDDARKMQSCTNVI